MTARRSTDMLDIFTAPHDHETHGVAALPSWLRMGERAVWLRRGVVTIEHLQETAGEQFLIVKPYGWTAEPGWISVRGLDEQLRPLTDRETCERWLAMLRAHDAPPTPGELIVRRSRQRRTIDYGTAEAQVTALAAAYNETFRPEAEDLETIAVLERLVVAEISSVLGVSFESLRDELRAHHPRFSPDAEPSSKIVEPEPVAPTLPEGWDWFASFDVAHQVHVIDFDDTSLALPAEPGRWHAAYLDSNRWIAAREDSWPLDPELRRVAARTNGYLAPVAVLADDAVNDPLILEDVWRCEAFDAWGRGAAQFWREPVKILVWERENRCIAIEVRLDSEEVYYEDEEGILEPGDLLVHPREGVLCVLDLEWNDDADDWLVIFEPIAGGEHVRLLSGDVEQQLRPLVSREEAMKLLGLLMQPQTPRPPSDVTSRDARYRDAIEHGTLAERVAALASLYSELGDADMLAELERLVLPELAEAAGVDLDGLVERVRSNRPATALAPSATPSVPADDTRLFSFDVKDTLDITDLTHDTVTLRASRGCWHAVRRDERLLVVADCHVSSLANTAPTRTLHLPGERDFPVAVLDGGALSSEHVANVLIAGNEVNVDGRGVAWLPTIEPVSIRVWEVDGECIAVEIEASD